METTTDRRRAEGPRLALTMADMEANFGDFKRAVYWSSVAQGKLGRLPTHYRDRHAMWQGVPPAEPSER